MKILTLSNCPLKESLGSGYVILKYCQGLRSLGHEVDVYGPESFELFPFLQGKGKIDRLTIGMLLFALRKIRTKNYDIIELYGAQSWLTAWVFSRIPKRNFITISHSNGIENHVSEQLSEYQSSQLTRKPWSIDRSVLYEKAFTAVDGIVTVSQFDLDYARRQDYQPASAAVAIENPLPDSFLGLSVQFERQPKIGFCGSWIDRKGIQTIQADMPKLLREFPHCQFMLIGVGESFRKEEVFPEDVCDRITAIAYVDDRDRLQKLYEQFSISIVPSLYESFGLVTSEAMACGVAVVATKTGFAAHLKHRENAMLLDRSRSPQLYEATRSLLLDEALRRSIAEKGYRRVQSLRWDTAIKTLESTYLNWLDSYRKNRVNLETA
ncbi:glycosyltransferase family 4 protein [Synechococcus sp. PCC 7336]|uniref:glycosyltransferase family 4 protein n=1 Tax=Synechococcus sp. PCC 7336 TaxID=195250 RepID=UPI00034D4C3A|nr:glycosyltransferase family 4 protein [Synechococcus sp. PCC 7336]